MKIVRDLFGFFGEVSIELSKVEWPKFNNFVKSTLVVLFMVVVFTVYLGVVDWCIFQLTNKIFMLSL